MIYAAYPDEEKRIELIQSVRNSDYALLRLTPTMMRKNDTDCNGIFRTMLKKMDIVDYDNLKHGSENGRKFDVAYIRAGVVDTIPMNFYIVNGKRGDRRMTINKIGTRIKNGELNVDDLLYFSTYEDSSGMKQIFLVNLTSNSPSVEELRNVIGVDAINKMFEEIRPLLKKLIQKDEWIPNYKGEGDEAPKDVGETLEHELAVDTNNRDDADIGGLIELKGKGSSGTKDTLLTLRPSFDGTFIERVEEDDSHRVKVFPLYYGYESTRHSGCKDLYVTIGTKEAPQNQHGLYLEVDEQKNIVKLMAPNPKTKKIEMAAYWSFDALETALQKKHPSTLWIDADKEIRGNQLYYNFKKIEFSRSPKFLAFISLIKTGEITYDWRGHTSLENRYSGVNKGNAWRIKPRSKNALFGSIEVVEFQES